MKPFLLFDNEKWHPSTFYDKETKLLWIMEYKLFTKIYTEKKHQEKGIKYAIHKDVFDAFLFKFRTIENRKKRETRKSRFIKSLNKSRKIKNK